MTQSSAIPVAITDPINRAILEVSEDQVQGFVAEPFAAIAEKSGQPLAVVLERIRAMLEAGVIRRVRQTLMTTSLAPGALVAWRVPEEKLAAAFDWMFENDPFTGHVVIRTTDADTAGATYRLWTTLKVPQGYSMQAHGDWVKQQVGAEDFLLMPARKVFALGVGHMRRRNLEPGARTDAPARILDTSIVELSREQWQVLTAMKRELDPEEIAPKPWIKRAEEAGVSYERFLQIGQELDRLQVIGRFSTFLEHVKKQSGSESVTRYNALFHWAVPPGKEMQAGTEVGRHIVMTHAYWREGGPIFNHVNVMGVAHGTDKARVLEHKAAIDQHLEEAGIPVSYTNVFWGGRSEIKPSEISPQAYEAWCESHGIDPASMLADK